MTVALVPPKRGVFQESVKHVLAVATTVEVVLLAVTYQQEGKGDGGGSFGSSRNRRLQVRARRCLVFNKMFESKKIYIFGKKARNTERARPKYRTAGKAEYRPLNRPNSHLSWMEYFFSCFVLKSSS